MSGNPATKYHGAIISMFLGLFCIGALALAAGLIFNYERRAMYGIAIGCAPTGALGAALSVWISRWAASRRPDLIQKQANSLDERSVQIRYHAGYSAFWVICAYVFLYTLLSPTQLVRSISPTAFGITTSYVLIASYWTSMFVCSRKY